MFTAAKWIGVSAGEVYTARQRENGGTTFEIRVPKGLAAQISLPAGADSRNAFLPDGGALRFTLPDTIEDERSE